MKEVVALVQQRTGVSPRFKRGQLERHDQPGYALFALREGLVNAIVHRDYAVLGGDVRVEIFPNHLVIRNPGRLPDGWTTENLRREHVSHLRNPDIAGVFHWRGLMEKLGKGAGELMAVCKALRAKAPEWKAQKNVVSLTLFRAPEPENSVELPDRQTEFLRDTRPGASFKAGDYMQATGRSERQSRRDLGELESLGFIERRGKGPATRYERTERPAP